MSQLPQVSKLLCRLQMHNLQGRNHHPLFLVIGWWDPNTHLEAVQGRLASLGLVGPHASDHPPKDVAGCPEGVGAMGWAGVHLLAEESQVLQLVSVGIARHDDALTAHNYDLPA